MTSRKTAIIEDLFDQRWDPLTRTVTRPLVTLADVTAGIGRYNAAHPRSTLSSANPANFFKDFIRNGTTTNANWPTTVFARGYTARQQTGGGASFVFVPLAAGQPVPFPPILPSPAATIHRVESASLPLASRRLGRTDESWLVQVLVRLRVVETHLSLFSTRRVVQVDHLQMGVKRSGAEIDALFLVTEETTAGLSQELIVCFEAKGRRDAILEAQILSQVQEAFSMFPARHNSVIPMAAKAFAPSKVFIAEFAVVTRAAAPTTTSLAIASEAIYEFVPAVPGIGR